MGYALAIKVDLVPDLPANEKHVLRYLALRANKEQAQAFPGIELLMQACSLSRREVYYCIESLREKQWITALPGTAKTGFHTIYCIDLAEDRLLQAGDVPKGKGGKSKTPRKVRLKPAGAAPPLPDLNGQAPPDNPMLRNMERMNRSISSYWRLRQSKNPDAWLSEPGREDVAAFLREYQAMVTRLDPDAGRFELGAMYAQQILAERKGAKV